MADSSNAEDTVNAEDTGADDFLNKLQGKRVTVVTLMPRVDGAQTYGGILERIYPDALVIAMESGSVLIYKHAIGTVTEIGSRIPRG